jgi:hypothetical protein
MERLHGLIPEVWKKEEMPEYWKKGILCPTHKKGYILERKNYRGISLLKTAYKVLSNIIHTRLEAQNLLGCTAMFLIECRLTFQRYVLPPASP